MKIAQLLEMPQDVAPNSPLARARARDIANFDPNQKYKDALEKQDAEKQAKQDADAKAKSDLVAQQAPQTAPAVAEPANTQVATQQQPGTAVAPANTAQNDLDAIKQLSGVPAKPTTAQVPAKVDPTNNVTDVTPNPTPANTQVATQQQAAPGQPKKSAWDMAKAVGRGVKDTAIGAVKGVGDVAAQTAAGAAQTVGAIGGGMKHGWSTAAKGDTFGDKNSFGNVARQALGAPQQASSQTTSGGGTAPWNNAGAPSSNASSQSSNVPATTSNDSTKQISAVSDEVEALKDRLGKIEQLVRARA
jgi:hypothetical protein